MSHLIDVVSKFMGDTTVEVEIHEYFEKDLPSYIVELLTFSSYDEIVAMLDYIEERYPFETPVWLVNLTYRLACLLAPNDADIKRRAAGYLLCVGPDWDEIAENLYKEADEIEAAAGTEDV